MLLFGKSHLQRAIEERDTIIRSIQHDLPTHVKTTLPNRDPKFIAEVRNRVSNMRKDVLSLDKGEEVQAVVGTIPDELGEAKYYFLEAVWYYSNLTKAIDREIATSSVSGYLQVLTGMSLSNYIHERGVHYARENNIEFAMLEFQAALE